MVNSAGVIQESIWRDREFRALPRTAQTMYVQLLSQKELDRSGIQPLQVAKWAKGCDEMTESDVWRDLKILEERRFIFTDTDTDELFVRSYMRQSNVIKQPNLMKNALRCAGMIGSESLRREMATELRRLRRSDAAQVAASIDPGEPIANPSERHPEPFLNPSRTVNPSETHREPWGEGEGEGEGTSDLLVKVRDGRATEPDDNPDSPPSSNCSKHPNGTAVACRPCGQAREARAKWDTDRVRREGIARSAEARSRAEVRAQAIRACDMCDDAGYLVGGSLCDHDPNTIARASRGLAAVKAALNGTGGRTDA